MHINENTEFVAVRLVLSSPPLLETGCRPNDAGSFCFLVLSSCDDELFVFVFKIDNKS